MGGLKGNREARAERMNGSGCEGGWVHEFKEEGVSLGGGDGKEHNE